MVALPSTGPSALTLPPDLSHHATGQVMQAEARHLSVHAVRRAASRARSCTRDLREIAGAGSPSDGTICGDLAVVRPSAVP